MVCVHRRPGGGIASSIATKWGASKCVDITQGGDPAAPCKLSNGDLFFLLLTFKVNIHAVVVWCVWIGCLPPRGGLWAEELLFNGMDE
jgi:hypothetical protein